MKRILILALLLAVPGIVRGQATPTHTTFVGPCSAPAQDALRVLADQKAAPKFDLFVVCNSPDWASLMAKNDLRPSETALTDWSAGRMFLGPKTFTDQLHLREVIAHELEHLRCHCDLGERNPHH